MWTEASPDSRSSPPVAYGSAWFSAFVLALIGVLLLLPFLTWAPRSARKDGRLQVARNKKDRGHMDAFAAAAWGPGEEVNIFEDVKQTKVS